MARKEYTGTLTYPTNLEEAKVILYITEETKYEAEDLDNAERIETTGLLKWAVVEGGEEAETIRELTGLYDEYNEYLILYFANGRVEFHRNSHVTMFIW